MYPNDQIHGDTLSQDRVWQNAGRHEPQGQDDMSHTGCMAHRAFCAAG